MPEWAFRREYGIDFESIGGAPVYPEWSELEGGNIIRPFEIPKRWKRYRVIDPGFRNPFACLWFAVSEPGWDDRMLPTVIVYREHYEAGQRTDYHKEMIHRLTGKVEIEFTVIDPEARVDKGYSAPAKGNPFGTTVMGRKTYQMELHNPPYALPTIPFQRMRSEYAEIEIVARAIKSRQFQVFASCTNTIREHRRWTWKERPNPESHNPFETPTDKDNHTCDCVKYFFNSPWEGSPILEEEQRLKGDELRHRRFWERVHRERREIATRSEDGQGDPHEAAFVEDDFIGSSGGF
jgi:hypothetical protein